MANSKLDQIKAHLKELDRLEAELRTVLQQGLREPDERLQQIAVRAGQRLLNQMKELTAEAQQWKAELASEGLEGLPEIPKLDGDR